MIANTTKGTSIGRAVDYITDERNADWFKQRNISDEDKEIMKDDMSFTAAKCVASYQPGHTDARQPIERHT